MACHCEPLMIWERNSCAKCTTPLEGVSYGGKEKLRTKGSLGFAETLRIHFPARRICYASVRNTGSRFGKSCSKTKRHGTAKPRFVSLSSESGMACTPACFAALRQKASCQVG